MRTLDPVSVLRRRARRGHLDRSGTSPDGIASALVGLHATDPATVHLSVYARQPHRPLADVARALRAALEGTGAPYVFSAADGSPALSPTQPPTLVRLLGMRRTLHIVPAALAPAVQALARHRLAPDRRRDTEKLVSLAGARELSRLEAAVLKALTVEDLDTDALAERVPDLALRVRLAEGKAYEADTAIARFVLELLGTEGAIVRARALGGWRTNRTTWARTASWIPDLPPPPPSEAAYAVLARAWLSAFGPGTLEDFAWWAGLPKGQAKAGIAALGSDVEVVRVAGWAGDRFSLTTEPAEDRGPPVGPALLPALDPAGMCWTNRAPFLDPALASALFDRSGNIGPTVWVDGRVVGGWGCRPDGSVVVRVLEPGVDEDAVRAEAARLEEALAGEVVRPRFPTPLVKEIHAG